MKTVEPESTVSLVARYLAHVAAARAIMELNGDTVIGSRAHHVAMVRGLAKDIATRRDAGDVIAAGVIGAPHFLTHNGKEI